MAGDENQPAIFRARRSRQGVVGNALHHPMQGINHRIARGEDVRVRYILTAQLTGGMRCRGKMPIGQTSDQHAVDFLGKRRIPVVRAQARFHVTDRDAVVERGQRTDEGTRRVALHQHGGDRRFRKDGAHFGGHARREIPEILARPHNIEVDIHRDAEIIEDLSGHLAMLGGGNNQRRQRG